MLAMVEQAEVLRQDLQHAAWPAAAPVDGTNTTFEVIDTLSALDGLQGEWNALFARAGEPHQVFQSHGFARIWAESWLGQGKAPPLGQHLAIVVARRDGRLVMVWPLVRQRLMGLTIVSWLGAPVAQYGDVLIERCADQRSLLEHGWREVKARLAPDLVRLRKVRADAAVAALVGELESRQVALQDAPAVTLMAAASSGFEERQSSKARKNRRRLLRRLEETGTVRFEHAAGSSRAAALALAGLAFKRRWLKDRGLYSAAFSSDRLDRFFAAAMERGAIETGCQVFSLTIDGRPVAVAIGFATERRLSLHMISYDLDYEKAGVGVLNIEAILRHCEAAGLEVVDFLAPNADYKMAWADTTVGVADHVVALTAKGKAFARVIDGLLLPGARSTLAHAGPKLRNGLRSLLPVGRIPAAG